MAGWAFKVAVEMIFTPLTYAAVAFLKTKEHIDYYDQTTQFNPLRY
jgi:queuosine precursor transporter